MTTLISLFSNKFLLSCFFYAIVSSFIVLSACNILHNEFVIGFIIVLHNCCCLLSVYLIIEM